MREILYTTKSNFMLPQRGSIDYLGQRNGDRICVLGNEEDSFLNQESNITGKIFGGILHKTQL